MFYEKSSPKRKPKAKLNWWFTKQQQESPETLEPKKKHRDTLTASSTKQSGSVFFFFTLYHLRCSWSTHLNVNPLQPL